MVARTSAFGRTLPSVVVLGADILGIILCLNVAHFIRLGKLAWLPAPLIATIAATLLALYVMDTYGVKTGEKFHQIYIRTIIAVILASVIIIALSYAMGVWRVYEQPILWRSIFPPGMLTYLVCALGLRHWMTAHIKSTEDRRRWLVVGQSDTVARFVDDFAGSRLKGRLISLPRVPVVGVVASGSSNAHLSSLSARRPALESTVESNMATAVDYESLEMLQEPWTGIIIADDKDLDERTLRAVLNARLSGTHIMDLTAFYERHWLKLPIHGLKRAFFVEADGFALVHDPVARKLKRVFDVVFAITALILLVPLAALIGGLIRIDSKGPVFYKQRRAGLDGSVIKIYKFRTMDRNAELGGAAWAVEDDPRITRIGKWLRWFRLDELPQLVNVLKGQMSLIGPRPERPEFVDELTREIPFYQMRTIIKPGITGWAQVNLDYAASLEDAEKKLSFDLFYVKNYSMLLDLIIVFKTLRVVLFGRGR